MKRTLLALSTILSTMTFAQDCSELFISEYVEGWSNNKALEIYNPTNAAIDLSDYMVIRFSNGSNTATAANAIQLVGTVAAHDVHVAVLEKLDPMGTGQEAPIWDSLQVRADEFYCPDYNTTNAFYFNGDDAVVLSKGNVANIPGQIVDIFGKIGEDPGAAWTADFPYVSAGAEVTKDHSLIRKSTVLHGETNPTISYFDPLLEYDSIPAVVEIGGLTYGNWFSLGTHDCGCNPLSVDEIDQPAVAVFPNPSNGKFYVNGVENFSSIWVVNSLGQKVKSIDRNVNSLVAFDLGSDRGVYFVKLTDNKGNTITKRVIIK
ncbi:MAG: T9SS type A sorting domain-containing protein [Crocinitomicaceae bacterium]|nr:T9SS type A sorting domain-containing protein [Crocinitomicaceae bacterium]